MMRRLCCNFPNLPRRKRSLKLKLRRIKDVYVPKCPARLVIRVALGEWHTDLFSLCLMINCWGISFISESALAACDEKQLRLRMPQANASCWIFIFSLSLLRSLSFAKASQPSVKFIRLPTSSPGLHSGPCRHLSTSRYRNLWFLWSKPTRSLFFSSSGGRHISAKINK